MCLGIPMEVIAVDGYIARCSAQGVEREVSLFMLQDEPIAAGDSSWSMSATRSRR